MRKSKKRVIAIITCCFVLATFCLGIFADEVQDPYRDRVGTVLTTTPFDLGSHYATFANGRQYVARGYYIMKVSFDSFYVDASIIYDNIASLHVELFHMYSDYVSVNNTFNDLNNNNNIYETGTYYIYIYVGGNLTQYNLYVENIDSEHLSIELYNISNRSVIDSVYSNSQDVHSSLVSVINEATNIITTNNVVMMFCILIPVISFGAGILIRLRKRA